MVAEHFHSQADEDDSRTSFQMKRGEPVQFAGQEKPAAVQRKVVAPMTAAGRNTAWNGGEAPHWTEER